MNCAHCAENDVSADDTCLAHYAANNVEGFMWFNYSTLSNPHRTAKPNYERLVSAENLLSSTLGEIRYSSDGYLRTLLYQEGDCELELYSSQGSLLLRRTLTNKLESQNLSILPQGVYFCRLIRTTTQLNKKIVIMH